jgi:hypothetical protein
MNDSNEKINKKLGDEIMKLDELLEALTISERLVPNSDISNELKNIFEYKENVQRKRKYINKFIKNEFQERGEIEKLTVQFKDDLLFMYDITHFTPNKIEKEDYKDLNNLQNFINVL